MSKTTKICYDIYGDLCMNNFTFLTDEQIFVFAHEVCHIAFDHILRSEGKVSSIWNISTDAVINAFLKKRWIGNA